MVLTRAPRSRPVREGRTGHVEITHPQPVGKNDTHASHQFHAVIDAKFRPLYAHQQAGGIPGLPSDAVIEICGNIYGQNDAPAAWFKEFASFVVSCGWQSKLDQCLFTLRDPRETVQADSCHGSARR